MLTDFLIETQDSDKSDPRYAQYARLRRRRGIEMLEALRAELARRRAEGQEFDAVWARSVDVAMRGISYHGEERRSWRAVLKETQGAWRSAYEMHQADEVVERVGRLEELVTWPSYA